MTKYHYIHASLQLWRKTFFLKFFAKDGQNFENACDENGLQYAQSSTIGYGDTLNINGCREVHKLSPHIYENPKKNLKNFKCKTTAKKPHATW